MSRVEVFSFVCSRRGHKVAAVVDDDDGRWLEIEHHTGLRRAPAGTSARVRLSPARTDRIGCRACGRSVLLAHVQIIDAIGRGADGMTI